MNNTTKALLVSLGLASAIGTLVLVLKPSNGAACRKATLTCDFNLNMHRVAELDRLNISTAGNYVRLTIPVELCATDSGDIEVVVVSPDGGATAFIPDDVRMCEAGEFEAGQKFPAPAQFVCASNPLNKNCERRVLTGDADAGEIWVKADGTVMGPTEFRGPDCLPRPCVELFGQPWNGAAK